VGLSLGKSLTGHRLLAADGCSPQSWEVAAPHEGPRWFLLLGEGLAQRPQALSVGTPPCKGRCGEAPLCVTTPGGFQLLAEMVLNCFRDDSLKPTLSLFHCFLQGHGTCTEHTGTCARQIIKVPTNTSTLVGIMMLPKEDLAVLGQPE